jgi:hypothetical protein
MITAKRLKKAGFSYVGSQKCGMYKKVYWVDPVDHEVIPQYLAVLYLQERNRAAKLQKNLQK